MSAAARPLADPAVRRVAVVRLRVGLGDLLASVPALRDLRAARPDVEVTVVTWAEMTPVLARQAAYVDALLDFPGYPGIPERTPQPERVPAFLDEARRRRFDLALQMYGAHPKANEVTALLGARRTGGFFTPGAWKADLATHLPYPDREHEVHRHQMLVEFLGVPPGPDALEFPLWPADVEARDGLLADRGLEPGGYVCVHPGATAASRRWPPQRFAAVADALARRGWPVVLTGVRGEEAVTGAVAEAMVHPAADVCGATDLGTFAAVVDSAALLVTNDSGPAHLAAALATPSVTVFLAGDPLRWRALDTDRHRVVTAGAPCQPCGHLDCPIDFRCAADLDPRRVAAEAESLLAAAATGRQGA